MDTIKRRKAREQQRLSLMTAAEIGEDDLEGNLDELITRLQNGDPWSIYSPNKRRGGRRASSSSALSRAWMQVSRERIDHSEANGFQQEEVS